MAKKKVAAKKVKKVRTLASEAQRMAQAAQALEEQRHAKDPGGEVVVDAVAPAQAAENLYSRVSAEAEMEIDAAPGLDVQDTVKKARQAGAPLPASARHPLTQDETRRDTASSTHASTNGGAGGDEEGAEGGEGAAAAPAQGVGVPDAMLAALRDASPARDMFSASSGGPTAFHDFAAYEFLFDPWRPMDRPLEINAQDMSYFNSVSRGLSAAHAGALRRIYVEMTACARRHLGTWMTAPGGSTAPVDVIMTQFATNLVAWGMPVIAGPLGALDSGLWRHFVDSELEPWLFDWARETAVTGMPARISNSSWTYLADAAREISRRASGRSEARLFVPYSMDTVNFGLRLNYRQEWKSLGDQYGEIARTIPLGPRQSEKVSVKILKRNKGTRQMESTEATETQSEVSNTTKTSSEIVEEAASSNKWHVEAEVSGSVSTVGASASAKVAGGASGEASQNSKNSKSNIGEAMRKSAHKMRRETKVTVATETEVSYQEERSSEITNPNDEIAITYVYQLLQRQYEIHTYLAEAASVIYVAEYVPPPGRLEAWLKRYAWIVGEVLLDESYRDVLNLIANEAPRPGGEFDERADFGSFVRNAAGSVSQIPNLGGTLTNLFDATQKSYADISREQREDARYRENLAVRRLRFLQHVEDNILHYCRAVWSREDGEQRMMRYGRIMVPADIDFTAEAGSSAATGLRGRWQASSGSASYVPLSKLINPAGPIGFSGNYAVFYMREDPTLIKHNFALQVLSAPYYESLGFDVVPAAGNAAVASQLSVSMTSNRPAAQLLQLLLLRRFSVKVAGTAAAPQAVLKVSFPGFGDFELPPIAIPASGVIGSVGMQLRFAPLPAVGDVFEVASISRFRDPELAAVERDNPLPATGSDLEEELFSPATVDEMLDMMPRLKEKVFARFAAANTNQSTLWDDLTDDQRSLLRGEYHAYLLRKEHTRRFLVDTNSLVLNLIPGTGSALEPFKRAHRYIDVLKEANEVQRRKALIDGQNYGDPDVEKVVLIGNTGSSVGAAVVGAEAAVPASPAAPVTNGTNNGHNR